MRDIHDDANTVPVFVTITLLLYADAIRSFHFTRLYLRWKLRARHAHIRVECI